VVEFDPLLDPLPGEADALVLPGGFPEQFTAELSANDLVRRQISALATAGAPVHAECAGLVYLVDDLDGTPMCGVLAGTARFTDRLTIGYRDAVASTDSSVHPTGARVVGHEFHRTQVTFARDYGPAWMFRTGAATGPAATTSDGAVHAGVHAAYLHAHAAAHPLAVTRFVAAAAAFKLTR
jgi:cobyrinic acid a,c-diamide synthase